MSTTAPNNIMEYSILDLRNQLQIFDDELKNDNKLFNEKLNLTRKNFFDYINRLIEQVNDIKNEYELEFHYLENENKRTCNDNQQQLENLYVSIDKYENDQDKVWKHFYRFQETFSIRPNMLKNIPEFHFEDLRLDSLIRKMNKLTLITNQTDEICHNNEDSISIVAKTSHSLFPILSNDKITSKEEQLIIDNPKQSCSSFHSSILHENATSFVPITPIISDDDAQIPITLVRTNQYPHDQQFLCQNNSIPSRSVPTISTINEFHNRIDILFQIPYKNDRQSRLMAYNIQENSFLIYSLISHQFEYLSLQTRRINLVGFPSNKPLISLGYSTYYHCFYSISKQTHDCILFYFNDEEIHIKRQFQLTHENRKIHSIIIGHIYENNLYFLYNYSSEITMFGTYNFDQLTFKSPRKIQNICSNEDEQIIYEIIDFTVDMFYITFLIRLKYENRYMIIINDHDINQIFSFDLIDAIQPLSIVSILKTSQLDIFNEENQLLLFINDPKSHLIHCCTYERYLISISVNSFAICSFNDGNIAIVANKDIRGLNIQDYLQQNHIQVD